MNWNIDPTHSAIHFSVRHMVFAKVRGSFDRWTGELELNAEALDRSGVRVEIDASSINSGVEARDNHLRSPDFFDVATFPKISFVSSRIVSRGSDRFDIEGDLTIRGVTQKVTLESESLGQGKDPFGNQRAAFSATTRIDRRAFGLIWNQALETGGVLVGENIDVELNLQAIAQANAVKKAG